jgi:hypothetical protein
MELFKKVMNVVTNLYPRTSMRIEKRGGAYVIVDECTWLGNHTVLLYTCKKAVETKIDLLKL